MVERRATRSLKKEESIKTPPEIKISVETKKDEDEDKK